MKNVASVMMNALPAGTMKPGVVQSVPEKMKMFCPSAFQGTDTQGGWLSDRGETAMEARVSHRDGGLLRAMNEVRWIR